MRIVDDEGLARSAPWVCLGPDPISAEKLVERILIGHVEGHLASIRRTIEQPVAVA